MTPDRCRTCKAPVRWVTTTSGRPMPIDPEPRADGNIMLDDHDVAHVVGANDPRGAWVSHFATCPDAATHRRPKEGT